ncbi:hypothetical protein [Streptomyces cavernae]|uniref:hypothetical protein n=1 Tax=Streptomyces cavernae TaxID=2259034 RepID=UPI001EE41A54|nr:hypothetical protein [Streptomyces cavernae]
MGSNPVRQRIAGSSPACGRRRPSGIGQDRSVGVLVVLAEHGEDHAVQSARLSLFGRAMAGDVLLPGEGARITPTTFEEWLTKQ